MISVFVYGSCTSRGCFDFAHAEGMEKQFKVQEYVAKNSLFSLFAEPIHIEEFQCVEDPHTLEWMKRMVYLDLEKKAIEIIQRNKADIFVMDLIDERLMRGHLNGDKSKVFTYSEAFKKYNYMEVVPEYSLILCDASSYFESYNVLVKFCDIIKKIYSPNQIFVLEAYPVLSYYDNNGNLNMFEHKNCITILQLTKQLEIYYEILKGLLPDCNWISMPRNICGAETHKWGLSSVHFEQRYYDYTLREIINKLPVRALG